MRLGGPRRARTNRRAANRTRASAAPRLTLPHAGALGLLHGLTELLPVSSSGHTTLVPWLAGWPYAELDPEQRKSFEVALHAGTAAALLLHPPATGPSGGPKFMLAAVIPPALTGYALGGPIERRLGTANTIAAGLLAGSLATIAAEAYAWRKRNTDAARVDDLEVSGTPTRSAADAGKADGLAVGLAQALALFPGVSRSGASLAACRARGFSRHEADRLSWSAGLPVIAGATALQGARLARTDVPSELRVALATGAGCAFLSTLVSVRLLGQRQRVTLLPASTAYRVALALFAIRRMR
jgi:undecaprenyl-diphosphatase